MFNALTQSQLGKDVKIVTERNNKIQEKIVTAISDSFSIEGIGVFHKMDPQVRGLLSNSPASEAGLQPGDFIKGINGTDITHWVQMSEIIRTFPGEEIRFKIDRDGKDLFLNIKPDALIDEVEENSPAELAGLKTGDKIRTINSKDVSLWKKPLLDKSFAKEDELIFEISRDSIKLAVTINPQEIQDMGIRVSGKVGIIPFEETIFKRYGIFDSIIEGFKQAFEMTELTLWALGKMFTLQISLKTLGGPIMIAKMTGTAAKSGVASLLIFTAFLSLNLSIINLLPIPILDGGHLFFLLV
jgi:regulator of sigma E protease